MACITIEQSKQDLAGEFLNFLSRDITNNPQLIKSISPDLASRIQSLSLDADIDLDELLLDEDE
jgi:hypothetical protein